MRAHLEMPVTIGAPLAKTLIDAGAHISARRDVFAVSANDHVRSASAMLNRTLCLASSFNAGSSGLAIFAGQQTHAGHYSRSFDHDLVSSIKGTAKEAVQGLVVTDTAKKKSYPANLGQVPNASTLLLHKLGKSFTALSVGERSQAISAETSKLYDASLKYRSNTAKYVAGELRGLTMLQVGAYNDYPAVMVNFDARTLLSKDFIKTSKAPDAGRNSFTEFLMSHYLGLVNAEAAQMGLHTAMVERSSFGHAAPSAAATAGSFRLNLGMMPPVYAEAHVRALKKLEQELRTFQNSLDQRHDVVLDKINGLCNSKHEPGLRAANNILELAFTRVESTGKRLIYSAVRTLNTKNFIDSGSFHMHRGAAEVVTPGGPIHASLKALLDQVAVAEDQSVSTRIEDVPSYDIAAEDTAAAAGTTPAASQDTGATPAASQDTGATPAASQDAGAGRDALAAEYGQYLSDFRTNFKNIAGSARDDGTRTQMSKLALTLDPANADIARSLDLANQLLMIHTLEKMEALSPHTEGGYGSDSDVEIPDTQGVGMRGKKVITHNGMRSLIASTQSAVKILFPDATDAKPKSIAYDRPYYETEEVIGDEVKSVTASQEYATADIFIKDINACVNNGQGPTGQAPELAAQFPQAKAWIIDTTSATTKQMHDVLMQFKNAGMAEALYLVSSGLKNEQGGADRNNYGTVRLFCKTEGAGGQLSEILGAIGETDRGLAPFAHEYRRTMKAMGMAPTNHSIVMADVADTDMET
ncbi:hypothetical protein [Pseudoduganella violacea]|uniref:Uncharacterized protein n=1 Tax=Pseudoduganella violacea TaxID=1715466 RepID=A0A7W5BF17_9BURK|nr:hypothetical protein [Pseudoduganella violacea]MBB3121966.1 hypothetical protein [Pseudoduganella violacea]